MGPITHMATVPMDIDSHRETATFQVADLKNHEIVLGMPWLWKHNPTIDWNENKMTFTGELCATQCLNSSPVVYSIPIREGEEESLHAKFAEMRQDKRVRIHRLDQEAKVPT